MSSLHVVGTLIVAYPTTDLSNDGTRILNGDDAERAGSVDAPGRHCHSVIDELLVDAAEESRLGAEMQE